MYMLLHRGPHALTTCVLVSKAIVIPGPKIPVEAVFRRLPPTRRRRIVKQSTTRFWTFKFISWKRNSIDTKF